MGVVVAKTNRPEVFLEFVLRETVIDPNGRPDKSSPDTSSYGRYSTAKRTSRNVNWLKAVGLEHHVDDHDIAHRL
jgi:hypothetical protein